MADTPPRRRRSSSPPVDRPPMPDDKAASSAGSTQGKQEPPKPPGKPVKTLQGRLEQFFVGMALPFAAAGDMHCATVLMERGPLVAEAWANLAAESAAVKKMLESLLKGGAWAGAISSTVALVVPIAAHHGAPIPDPLTAIILGRKPESSTPAESESPAATAHQNGNTSDFAPDNPASYPGVGNPTNN